MKLWNSSTARSTHNRPLISRQTAEPLVSFFAGAGTADRVGARLGNSLAQSGLQLAGLQDHECLRPGIIVGHRQMYVDGVAFRRKGVKPRPRSSGQL